MTNEAAAIPLIDTHPPAADQEAVAQFLRQNPAFFLEQIHTHLPEVLAQALADSPQLLTEIELPMPPAGVASLPHVVMRIQRERLARTTRQIERLSATAKDNARLDQILHHFASDLLRAPQRHPEQVIRCIHRHFTVDAAALVPYGRLDPASKAVLKGWLDSQTPLCGRLSEAQRPLVFDAQFPQTGSAALIAVGPQPTEPDWILALGRHAPDGFNPTQGTLFLSQIGDLVGAFLGDCASDD